MGAVGRRVTFRPAARIGAIAASLAAAAALLLPTMALASTTQIGSTLSLGQIAFTCPSGIDSVQSVSSLASYSVQSGGTITQWSIQAGAADSGFAALEVWSPTTTATVYQLVGMSKLESLVTDRLNIFTTSIPVTAGDLLGLHVEGAVSCFIYTGTGLADLVPYGSGPTPGTYGTETLDQLGKAVELNVAATVDVTVTPPPPPPPTPTSADQCKDGGWQNLTDSQGTPFKNQGDCVSFVATDGTNTGNGQPTVTPPPPPPATPTSADQCKHGGWQDVTDSQGTPFKNQGDCVSFVATDGTNAADGPPA